MTTRCKEMDKFTELMCEIQEVRKELDENVLTETDKMVLAAYDAFSLIYGKYCLLNLLSDVDELMRIIKEGQK